MAVLEPAEASIETMTEIAKNVWQVSPEQKDEKLGSPAASSHAAENQADINEKALLRKLDLRLLPPLTILYLLSFLDRSNVGNARLEGMADDINMSMRCQL